MLPISKQKELLVLYSIIQKKQTLPSLSTDLNIPKHTIKKYIQNLNYELGQSFPTSIFIQSNKKGEYWITSTFSENKVAIFHQLKLKHLKMSPYFQLLVLLTTNFRVPSRQITEKLFISSSYLTRIVNTLNSELAEYEIQITKSKSYFSLTGNELAIRLFSFLFLSNSFQLLEWPFKQISKEELKQIIPKESLTHSTVVLNTVYFWFAVVKTRIRHQIFLDEQYGNIADILKIVQENCTSIRGLNYQSLGNIEQSYIESENLYFIFSSLFILSDAVPYEQMINLGTLFSQQDTPAPNFAKQLIDAIKMNFKITFTEEIEILFIYFFTITYIASQLLNSKSHLFLELIFPRVTYLIPEDNLRRKDIQVFWDDFLTTFIQMNPTENKETFASQEIFYTLIYRLLLMGRKIQIFVYLRISKDITGNAYFKNKLSYIFNPEVVVITSDIDKAELIISDKFETPKKDKNVNIFVLGSPKKHEQWIDLTHIIQQMIIQKLLYEEE